MLRSKLKSQYELARTIEVDGLNSPNGLTVFVVEDCLELVVGKRSDIDGTINAATVAENKPH
jgi:hypothetical protein